MLRRMALGNSALQTARWQYGLLVAPMEDSDRPTALVAGSIPKRKVAAGQAPT